MERFSNASRSILRSTTTATGAVVDIEIENGVVTSIRKARPKGAGQRRSNDEHRAGDLDLTGFLILPSPIEPHAHLDKALLNTWLPEMPRDLNRAIAAMEKAYDAMGEAEIFSRARETVVQAVRSGVTAIRSHVDCQLGIGLRSVHALLRLKREMARTVDIQLVAMPGRVTGPNGKTNLELLLEALDLGVDLVGGAPWLEPEPTEAIDTLLMVASERKTDVDFHIDETTDPSVHVLDNLIDCVTERGFDHAVNASHCVSLGMQEASVARQSAVKMCELGITAVTLPQTNLYLQGRGLSSKLPRGLTAIEALRAEGVVLAGGGDNWRDPFNPMGRIDSLETASLLVTAGHLSAQDAYESVSTAPRKVMGLPTVSVRVGSSADFMAVRGATLEGIVAEAPRDRMVFRHGELISHTETRYVVSPGQYYHSGRAEHTV